MHRETKRQILNLLTTVEEAISYLQRNPENNREGLLRDCSLCAKSIVVTLRKDSEAHEKHVHLLAQFTEKIKQAQTGDLHAFQQALSAAKVKLAFLRRKMEKLATKLEVVFLPYKASMWDSLESIWRAANADPDCDAYVVPIPYYDLNPDHTPAKFHYEGDLYPENVPVTDYRKYDLAARRPDVIYIHNPYDGCNCVTSVDPAYYSDRLKQYTEMLVYVPYDVVMDEISEHMCQMPGVQNADRVIVQSEKIKRTYEKYMPEEKILALGSPKIDKVLWMQKHPPAMPEEWARIARGRKLVLYNTHLSPLIIDDGSVCRKLRYVFSMFKERNDVCLLWRPHPLSEATMQAMNPQALQEYVSLVEAYKKEKLGIYDESPDPHRAIALSEAYYGDWSSLVPMYGVTGKPIMLQNVHMRESLQSEEMRGFLSCANAVVTEKGFYFSALFFNGLFYLDTEKKLTTFLGEFPDEIQYGGTNLHIQVIQFERQLYFVPWVAAHLAEFDLDTGKFAMYPLPEDVENPVAQYTGAVLRNEYIYLIPACNRHFLRFDIRQKIFKKEDRWYPKIQEFVEKGELLFIDYVQVDQYIWCPFRCRNLLIRFDMETFDSEVFVVGDCTDGYMSITYDGRFLWLLSGRGYLVRWDAKETQVAVNVSLAERICSTGKGWFFCRYFQRLLYIFTENGDIWTLDTNTGKATRYNCPLNNFHREGKNPWTLCFFRPYVEDGVLFVFSVKENALLKINLQMGSSQSWKFYLTAESMKRIGYPRIDLDVNKSDLPKAMFFVLSEKAVLTIEAFCEALQKRGKEKQTLQQMSFARLFIGADNHCGMCIYWQIGKELGKIRKNSEG